MTIPPSHHAHTPTRRVLTRALARVPSDPADLDDLTANTVMMGHIHKQRRIMGQLDWLYYWLHDARRRGPHCASILTGSSHHQGHRSEEGGGADLPEIPLSGAAP